MDMENEETDFVNKPYTRRKEANLKDKKNNIKIDKKKLIKKEKILIPEIVHIKKNYQILIQNNKFILKTIQKKNAGFIRYFDISDNFPRADKYEADEEDINFLKEAFKLKSKDITQKEIARNKYVKLFEDCIVYLEETEDSSFENCQSVKNFKLSLDLLETITSYWIEKCKKLRRPLLRKNWKVILTKDKYGEVDRLKKAFHPRESRMNLRKTNRISKEDLLDIQKDLAKENDLAYCISKFIVYREKLKCYRLYCYRECSSKHIKEIEENLKKIKEKISFLDSNIKKVFVPIKPAPEVIKPPVVKEEPVHIQPVPKPVATQQGGLVVAPPPVLPTIKTNDLQFFFANAIKCLHEFGFKPEEFLSNNIDLINEKIKKIKQGRNLTKNNIEKKVNMVPETQNKDLDTSNLVLIKKQSLINPDTFFIEKLKTNHLTDDKYDLNNFTDLSWIYKNFTEYENNYSHLHIFSTNAVNPYSFNGKSNFIINDEITEKVKLKRYIRFFDFYDHQTIDVNPIVPLKNYEEQINKSVMELNLKNGFKNHLKKNKEKGSAKQMF
jgi:hypothetical protein